MIDIKSAEQLAIHRIVDLEKKKLILAEKSAKKSPKPQGFRKNLELSLLTLGNPHKLWVNGSFEIKRTVLKLAFRGKIFYDRNKGARTPLKALPHGAFMAFAEGVLQDGAPNAVKFKHSVFEELADWEAQFRPLRDNIMTVIQGGDNDASS